MRVLVIPEDSRKDKYILKPLFESLFRSVGKPKARIRVCEDPVLGGVREALKSSRISEVTRRHGGMTQIIILCVDRDGNRQRCLRLRDMEREFGNGFVFLAENAWEELETWVLAGLDLPYEWQWSDVRAEVHVKERYFEPLVIERGLSDEPDGGRKVLGEEASRRIGTIRQKCPDDFDALARRLEGAIQTS